jgi:hypothetical protein
MGKWLEARVKVFAPILFAVLISCSGAIARSLEAMLRILRCYNALFLISLQTQRNFHAHNSVCCNWC